MAARYRRLLGQADTDPFREPIAPKLYKTCQLGDKAALTKLLITHWQKPRHYDFGRGDPHNGDTPLHWICKHGWLDIVKTAIEKYGCGEKEFWTVHQFDTNRPTPVHYVVENDHTDILLYLINKYGCVEIIRKLLEHSQLSKRNNQHMIFKIIQVSMNNGVWKPDSKNSDGDTALHLAYKANRPDVVAFLLTEAKCDPNVPNSDGKTPIQLNFAYIKTLVYESETINSKGFLDLIFNMTSLTNCDETQCVELLKHLLNNCKCTWKPADKTSSGNTALHLACQANKCVIVDFLLTKANCDPNITNNDGVTPIQLTYYFSIIYNLAVHGAVVSSTFVLKLIMSMCQQSQMQTHIIDEHIKLLRVLLSKHTWNPNEKLTMFNGNTLLHIVCTLYTLPLVDFFLSEAKCDPNTKNDIGKTPIEVTWETLDPNYMAYSFRVLEMLIKHGATSTSDTVFKLISIAQSCYVNHVSQLWPKEDIKRAIELFKLSLKNCTWNPNDKIRENGDTALHVACHIMEPREIIHFLLSEAHCDPSVKNNEGQTPIGMANQLYHNPAVIQDLIRHGARADNVCRSNQYHRVLGTNKSLQSSVKIFIVGDPCVGKSTLVEALKKEMSFIGRLLTSAKVSCVDEKTAGIIPHDFVSKVYGSVTLYDFAGQREFYSSHAALLQTAVQSSPPIFVLVVNLCDSDENIKRSILYWLSFLENLCTYVSGKAHIITVGSHADKLLPTRKDSKMKLMCAL